MCGTGTRAGNVRRETVDLIRASDALARLHTAAHLPVKMEYRRESLVEECIRHNVEIRKIRKYLQTKKEEK